MRFCVWLVLCIVVFCSSSCYAEVVEISYDDGMGDVYEDFWKNQYKVVKFELVKPPFNLQSIELNWEEDVDVSDDNSMYKVYIESNGELVYFSKWLEVDGDLQTEIDLEDENLWLSDDFYVIVNAPSGFMEESLKLAVDIDSSGSSYYVDGNKEYVEVPNNYMISVSGDDNVAPELNDISFDAVFKTGDGVVLRYDISDADGDVTSLKCFEDRYSIRNEVECQGYDESSCFVTASSDNSAIYCRAFDSEYYSNSVLVEYEIDDVDPFVSLLIGSSEGKYGEYSNSGLVYLNVAVSDRNLDYCDVNGADVSLSNVELNRDFLISNFDEDGTYEFTVRCYDIAGNVGIAANSIIVDLTAPEISDFSVERTAEKMLSLNWSMDDLESGLSEVVLSRLSSDEWVEVYSTDDLSGSFDYEINNSDDSMYKLTLYDEAGNFKEYVYDDIRPDNSFSLIGLLTGNLPSLVGFILSVCVLGIILFVGIVLKDKRDNAE